MDTITSNPKTYGIYDSTGKRKDGLRKAFILIQDLMPLQKEIINPWDDTKWPLYFDQEYLWHNTTEKRKFIISFQAFYDGEFFAVARLYKEKEKRGTV